MPDWNSTTTCWSPSSSGVSVHYPERIHPLAAEVRRVVERVHQVLGPVRPSVTAADVVVEVEDVTPA